MSTETDSIRLKIADKPKYVRQSAEGDGTTKLYKLDYEPINASPAIAVYVNDAIQTLTTHYTVDTTGGYVSFVTAPPVNQDILFIYNVTFFTDAELESIFDESYDSLNLAASRALMAMAADAARVARKESLSGGAGLGSIVKDTAVTAQELRAAAKGFLDIYNEQEASVTPAEGLTEPIWTEAMYRRADDQEWYRNH